MFLATVNKSKQLLCANYIGRVVPADLELGRADVTTLLTEMSPGFRLLADLSQLEFMDLECTTELGRTMDLFAKAGVGMIVRVVPDPTKDIGLNILTVFHYPHHPRIVTCENLAQALRALAI